MKPKKSRNYWVICWNAEENDKGEKLSTRIFQTFLERLPPHHRFEAYGYNRGSSSMLFHEVAKGDHVFCYQSDEGSYVGLCEVEERTSRAPGGRCLVLATVKTLRFQGNISSKKALVKLSEKKAKELFKCFGLPWPGLPN
jgi:hypothetical protein